ncbi:hypothetical protein NHF39_04300 [Pseudomonas proteolytica]|nr:hypothetical protein [Pseudomonas proteolytica]USW95925.1 hypothetical protein NHF39_04300 [Pseudomonas proteolytica]USW99968.1 hypothetical protein NHF41_27005 [Pseudomonas proteolytica]
MLAKNVNDNAQNQVNRVVWGFFASKLAPTGDWWLEVVAAVTTQKAAR